MHKFAALGLLIAASLVMAVSLADAAPGAGGPRVGVKYVWDGPMGELTIKAPEGTPYAVLNSEGIEVAVGVTDSRRTAFPVANSGAAADGTILHVHVGNLLFAVTDPEWEWN